MTNGGDKKINSWKGYYYIGKQEEKRLVNFGNGRVFYRVSTDLDNKDGGVRVWTQNMMPMQLL